MNVILYGFKLLFPLNFNFYMILYYSIKLCATVTCDSPVNWRFAEQSDTVNDTAYDFKLGVG